MKETKISVNRIYHPYYLWEDYQAGFYDIPKNKESSKGAIIDFFHDVDQVDKYMNMVTEKWVFSCEHNLTNPNMNRVAYIGQAAVCLALNISSLSTMYAWKFINEKNRNIADITAIEIIKKWEQKTRLKNISKHGLKRGTEMEYQMKLRLF